MLGSSDVSPSRRSFLSAFKPRQVILLEHRLKNPSLTTPMARNDAEKQGQLNQDEHDVLICSVAMWLETKGFSKVLKRFLSCAQIQDDSWKTKAVNLNEVFSQYLETCRKVHEDSGPGVKKQEEKLAGATEENGNCLASEEIESKKKKKKKTKGQDAVIDSAETLDGTIKSNEKAQEDKNCKGFDALVDDDKKSKAPKGPDDGIDVDSNLDQSAKKQKDKKKKKGKLTSDLLDSDVKQIDGVPEVAELKEKDSLAEAAVTGVNESKKASKKRKKKDTEEKENQFSEKVALEESKPKKSRHQEESKDALSPEGNALAGSNDEGTNVALNNNEVDKSDSKSAKKQHKNSAEPKSVNAFQRVKIDEVKFANEKLQDNSYWAKDGAEIGYGAKAQEVLGQVKGRDFRHEKTKKKRGSYRGGQIDLQSHSVKFNYSDEE